MPSFSRSTIMSAVKYLNFTTHAEIDQFILSYEMENADSSGGIEKRETSIMWYLIAHPDRLGPSGANLILEIIENTIKNALANIELHLAPIEDEVVALLEKFRFSVAKGHYEQALSAYTRGEWAAANAQLRSFSESLFDSIAETLVDDKKNLPSDSHQRREMLATKTSPSFFFSHLNEWEIGGKGGFIQGFWRRLHPQGSHPGLSDEEDSTFRLQIVVIVASHYLRRLEGWVSF